MTSLPAWQQLAVRVQKLQLKEKWPLPKQKRWPMQALLRKRNVMACRLQAKMLAPQVQVQAVPALR